MRFDLWFDLKILQFDFKNSSIAGNCKNSHSLRPSWAWSRTLYRGGENEDSMEAARQWRGDRGVGGYSDDQIQIAAVSRQQTRALPVTSLNPIQPADWWSKVYILHSHSPVLTSSLPFPGHAVVCSSDFLGPGLHFESSEFEHGGSWPPLSRDGKVVKFRLAEEGGW